MHRKEGANLMGTNFYTLSGKHIGKRSAAGQYCWNCNVTLCKGGKENVHSSGGFVVTSSNSIFDYIKHIKTLWYDKCPKCNKEEGVEPLHEGASGRELGFNKEPFKVKSGVTSCSSFTWDVDPITLKRLKYVKSEYGEKLTINEFYDMLKECPIQFYDSIGSDFS